MNRSALAILLTLMGSYAHAEFNPIPKESGFSGYGLLGGSYTEVNSNVLVGPKKSESQRLSSLDSQTSSDGAGLDLNLDLRYTFADSRTQVYLGNLIQDAVTLDFTQQLGVRTEMADKGIGSIAYVFSGIPGQAWSDPYQTGSDREETDRKSQGVRLGWDEIWGTKFAANYTYRKVEIENEQSGAGAKDPVTGAPMSLAQRALLDRNGETQALYLSYYWMGKQGGILSPSVTYTRNNADGGAASYDRYSGQLSYAWMQPKYSLVTNLVVNQLQYDEVNPVFGEKVDATEWGLNANFFWNKLAGVDKLSAVFSASYGESDANVDFFDSDMTRVSAGLLYKF